MDKMSGIMQGLRENALTRDRRIQGNKVTDYEKPEETGLPAANVLIYKLETVRQYRPSIRNRAKDQDILHNTW